MFNNLLLISTKLKMNRAVLVCTLCAVVSSSRLENVQEHSSSGYDTGSIVQTIETLSKVVEGLQTEIKMQASVLSNLVSKEELESILLNNLATKSDMLMQETSLKNLEATAVKHDSSLSDLQATVDELKTLLINSNAKEDEQLTFLRNLEAHSNMQTISINIVGADLRNQTDFLNNSLTKDDIEVNSLKNKSTNAISVFDGADPLTDIQNSSATQGTVEGIIVASEVGVIIIPLDTQDERKISNNFTVGVAFNWKSRQVYWINKEVEIKRADLDGSQAELLVSDTSYLFGLAVDQITGNLYYGVTGFDPKIRVCDSMGKKCETVASGINTLGTRVYDIVLFPSEGLMFWSNPFDLKSVTRANMDGTNATVIISEKIFGLYLDEITEKLYWTNYDGKSMGHYDLNGYSRTVVLNTTNDPYDIAVDGDTLYFGGENPNGVYSVKIDSNGNVSSISNITGRVFDIALYGENKVFSRPNPCENSTCVNLCVLSRLSYTCL